jgi:hypothetical protein
MYGPSMLFEIRGVMTYNGTWWSTTVCLVYWVRDKVGSEPGRYDGKTFSTVEVAAFEFRKRWPSPLVDSGMYQCLGFWVIRAGRPTQDAKIALAPIQSSTSQFLPRLTAILLNRPCDRVLRSRCNQRVAAPPHTTNPTDNTLGLPTPRALQKLNLHYLVEFCLLQNATGFR